MLIAIVMAIVVIAAQYEKPVEPWLDIKIDETCWNNNQKDVKITLNFDHRNLK